MNSSRIKPLVSKVEITFISVIGGSFLLLVILCTSLLKASPVQPNHPVYSFLRIMAVKGFIPYGKLGQLPMSEKEIISLLHFLKENREKINVSDKRLLKRYIRDFSSGQGKFANKLIYKNENQDISVHTGFLLHGQYQDSLPENDAFAFGTYHLSVKGHLLPKLSVFTEFSISQERNIHSQFLEQYHPSLGLPYNTPEMRKSNAASFKACVFDAFVTTIGWEGDYFNLEAGNGWNQWGSGIWQHHSFSQSGYFWVKDSLHKDVEWPVDGRNHWKGYRRGYRVPGEAAPITQIRFSTQIGPLNYVKFVGEKQGISPAATGYITGHRLEFTRSRWTIGLYELISFYRDKLEWAYSLPFVPLFFAEHQMGDRDNAAMGLDFQYIWPAYFRIYFDLFLDDLLSPTDFFKDYWGNKYAFTIGIEAPCRLFKNAELALEYSRVEPWLFTHHTPDNQLQHFGNLLGSHIPANSHIAHFRFTQHFAFHIDVEVEYSFYQHQHHDRGSSLFDIHAPEEPQTKSFLGKNPETRHLFTMLLGYSPLRIVNVSAGMGYFFVNNWRSRPQNELDGFTLHGSIQLFY